MGAEISKARGDGDAHTQLVLIRQNFKLLGRNSRILDTQIFTDNIHRSARILKVCLGIKEQKGYFIKSLNLQGPYTAPSS